jgi:uncharacterized membrane protein YhaH (DUF805 family)
MKSKNVKLHYRYSYFWLIFWLIVFFPVALVLLFTGSSFNFDHSLYIIEYNGSRFWLGFWTLFFFPVAFLLLFLNGLSVHIKKLH